jgi:DNA repair protein RecN (Recombination protein N)
MMSRLEIQNYAIIDELEIRFSQHLNVVTGETGAGKSILAGALGLILGDRADTEVLINRERKCVVEGAFSNVNGSGVLGFLEENELDISDELVIRREISPQGKSRAFINDTPVNLSQLQELGSLLVDLHRQFDTHSVGESSFQREVLDALAGHSNTVLQYRELFIHWQKMQRELLSLKEQKEQFEKEADFNTYQLKELDELSFRENEIEELEADLKMLSQAENIRSALERSVFMLENSETPMVQQLKSLVNLLSGYGESVPGLGELVERLRSSQVELQDISSELERVNQRVNFDPGKIADMEERVSKGYRLLKKHGVQSTSELLVVRENLARKLEAVLNLDGQISEREETSKKLLGELQGQAQKISEGRKRQVKPLEEKVNKLLSLVGMPNARLKLGMDTVGLQATGADNIEFLFNANVPADTKANAAAFQPLRKVASGGELSRLMLCIKSLVGQSMDLPTMIFDEIDSGISGEAARQVGIIMKELAANRQVICITHQPQIAGKGETHFFVYKEIVDKKVVTRVRNLENEERVQAIARMLSGEKPTAAAVQNAREMLAKST